MKSFDVAGITEGGMYEQAGVSSSGSGDTEDDDAERNDRAQKLGSSQ
jgi:hypothetical protein